MNIVAKFKCNAVTKYESGQEQVSFQAAYGPGNESWAKATPSGEIKMSISNPEACGKFEPGKSYLLNFTLAE
jgi:hypothetical protein